MKLKYFEKNYDFFLCKHDLNCVFFIKPLNLTWNYSHNDRISGRIPDS